MDARRRRMRRRVPVDMLGADLIGEPPSVYEAVTRQMVEGVSDELREIRNRVDNLLWMIAGAILLDTALRVMGV